MQASRYSSTDRIPEFCAPTRCLRADRRYPQPRAAVPRTGAHRLPDYQLMRARVANELATPRGGSAEIPQRTGGHAPLGRSRDLWPGAGADRGGETDQAGLELDGIWSNSPDRIEYVIADAEIDMARASRTRP